VQQSATKPSSGKWPTLDVLAESALNQRQLQAVRVVREKGSTGNLEYQEEFGVSRRTAHRDLSGLVEKRILERIGTTEKGTSYVLRKRTTKGPNGSREIARSKGRREAILRSLIVTIFGKG